LWRVVGRTGQELGLRGHAVQDLLRGLVLEAVSLRYAFKRKPVSWNESVGLAGGQKKSGVVAILNCE